MAENGKKNNRPLPKAEKASGGTGETPRVGKIAGPRRPQQQEGQKNW